MKGWLCPDSQIVFGVGTSGGNGLQCKVQYLDVRQKDIDFERRTARFNVPGSHEWFTVGKHRKSHVSLWSGGRMQSDTNGESTIHISGCQREAQ